MWGGWGRKDTLDYMNEVIESPKVPISFWHLYAKNHKSDLIIDLPVKHLLVYDPKTMGIWEWG